MHKFKPLLRLEQLEEHSAPGDITPVTRDALVMVGQPDELGGFGVAVVRNGDDMSYLTTVASGAETADLQFRPAVGEDSGALYVSRSSFDSLDDIIPDETAGESFGTVTISGTTTPADSGSNGSGSSGSSGGGTSPPTNEDFENAFDSAANAWNAGLAASGVAAPPPQDTGAGPRGTAPGTPQLPTPSYPDPEGTHASWQSTTSYDPSAFSVADGGLPEDMAGFEAQHPEALTILRAANDSSQNGGTGSSGPAAAPFDVNQILAANQPNEVFRQAVDANRMQPAGNGGAGNGPQPLDPQKLLGAQAGTTSPVPGVPAPLDGGRTTSFSFNGTLTYTYEWRVADPQGNIIRDTSDSVTYPLNATNTTAFAAMSVPAFPWQDAQFQQDIGGNFTGTYRYRETTLLDWTSHSTVEAGKGDQDWNWGEGFGSIGNFNVSDRSVTANTDLTYHYGYDYTELGGITRLEPTQADLGNRTLSADYAENEQQTLGWTLATDVRAGGVGGDINVDPLGPSGSVTPQTSLMQLTQSVTGQDTWAGSEGGHFTRITAVAGPGQVLPAAVTIVEEHGDHNSNGSGWQITALGGNASNDQLPALTIPLTPQGASALFTLPTVSFATVKISASSTEHWSDGENGHVDRNGSFDNASAVILQVDVDHGTYNEAGDQSATANSRSVFNGVTNQGTLDKQATTIVDVRTSTKGTDESENGTYTRMATTTVAGTSVATDRVGDYLQNSSDSSTTNTDSAGLFVHTGNGSIASGTFERSESSHAGSSGHIGGVHTIHEEWSAAQNRIVDTRNYTYTANDSANANSHEEAHFALADGDLSGLTDAANVQLEFTVAWVDSKLTGGSSLDNSGNGTGTDTFTSVFVPKINDTPASLHVVSSGNRNGTFTNASGSSVQVDERMQGIVENYNYDANVATRSEGGYQPFPGSVASLPPLAGAAPPGATSPGSGFGISATSKVASFDYHDVETSANTTTANGSRRDENSSDVTVTGDDPAGSNSNRNGQSSISSHITAHTTLRNDDSRTSNLKEKGIVGAGDWRPDPGFLLTPNLSTSGYRAEYRLEATDTATSAYTEEGNGKNDSTVTTNTNGDTTTNSSSRWRGKYSLNSSDVATSQSEERGYGLDISGFVQTPGPFTPGASGQGSVTYRTRTLKLNENDTQTYAEAGKLLRNSSLKGTGILLGKSNTTAIGRYSASENDHINSDLTVDAETWSATGALSFGATADLSSSSGNIGVSGGGSGSVTYSQAHLHSTGDLRDKHNEAGGRSSTENTTTVIPAGADEQPTVRTRSTTTTNGKFADSQTFVGNDEQDSFGRTLSVWGSASAGANGDFSVGWDGVAIGGSVGASANWGTDHTTYLGHVNSYENARDSQYGSVQRTIINDSGPPAPPPETTSQKIARYIDNGLAIPGGVYSRLPDWLQGSFTYGLLGIGTYDSIRDPVDPRPSTTPPPPIVKETIDANTEYHDVFAESGRFQRDAASTRNGSSASVGAGVVWDGGWTLPEVNLGSSSTDSSGQSESHDKQAYDYSGDYREWGSYRIRPDGQFRDPSDYSLAEHLNESNDRHTSGSYTSTSDGQTSSGSSEANDTYSRDLTHNEGGWVSVDGVDIHPQHAVFDETRSEQGDYDYTATTPDSSSHSWGDYTLDSTLHQVGFGANADYTYHLETFNHAATAAAGPWGNSSSSSNTAETLDLSRFGGLTTGHRHTHSWGSTNGQPFDNEFDDPNANGVAPLYAGPSYFRPGPTTTMADILVRDAANIGLMYVNGMTFGKIPILQNQVDKIKGEYGDMESVCYYSGAVTTVAIVVAGAVAIEVASGGTATPVLLAAAAGAGIGAGFSLARQTAEMLDGSRAPGDYSARGIISDAGIGASMGALYNCGMPASVLRAAQFGFMGLGIVSGLQNIRDGNYATGAFDLVTSIVPFAFKQPCFVGGTPIRTEAGSKPIETIRGHAEAGDNCDYVLSRNEYDPAGPVRAKRVLRTFARTSAVLNLHLGGKIIGTTGSHPFFAEDHGWIAAKEVRLGDRLLLESGEWIRVDGVADSGRVETVYNMEVEDDHTYFVGDPGWRFAVWAHNTCDGLHHYTPRFMGSRLPYKHPILTFFLQIGHTKIHRALNRYLEPRGMRPGPGNKGSKIIATFSKAERIQALRGFYRQYEGGAHYHRFIKEFNFTRRQGLFQ